MWYICLCASTSQNPLALVNRISLGPLFTSEAPSSGSLWYKPCESTDEDRTFAVKMYLKFYVSVIGSLVEFWLNLSICPVEQSRGKKFLISGLD